LPPKYEIRLLSAVLKKRNENVDCILGVTDVADLDTSSCPWIRRLGFQMQIRKRQNVLPKSKKRSFPCFEELPDTAHVHFGFFETFPELTVHNTCFLLQRAKKYKKLMLSYFYTKNQIFSSSGTSGSGI
jgi:hypothetical protein